MERIVAQVRRPLSLSQSWIFRGSRTTVLALLIENNPPGTQTHICTEEGGLGVFQA